MQEKIKLTKTQLQQTTIVLLKTHYNATFQEIADLLNLKTTEAKNMYVTLIRHIEEDQVIKNTQKLNITA